MQILVESLGGTFSYDYTENVTVLVSLDNKSDKYKIARQNLSTTIVKAQWLKESKNVGYFVRPGDYIFPEFYQWNFYLHYYDAELKSKIEQHRGQIFDKIDPELLDYTYIIVNELEIESSVKEISEEYDWFQNKFTKNEVYVVTNCWVETYLNRDYDNLSKNIVESEESIIQSEESKASPKIKNSIETAKTNKTETKVLHKYMKKRRDKNLEIEEHVQKLRKEPDFRRNFIMMDCVIYIDNMTEEDYIKVSKLLNIWGAFWYDNFIPDITTHIITSLRDKEIMK